MRKVFFYAMAFVAVTTCFTSCSKNENDVETRETNRLSVKLSGIAKSRTVEEPGTGAIVLTQGHIFVIDPLGRVIINESLDVEAAKGEGQAIADVPADSRVYILGNIPAGDVAGIIALGTFNAIKAASSAIGTQNDYTTVALANSDGLPQAIVVGADEATVNISLKPLISRIELTQVKGSAGEEGDRIMAFTVTGVYLDDYYPSFTYGGGFSGDMFSQGASTAFDGTGDDGAWEATGSPSLSLAANPTIEDDQLVWAHNVASGSLPRLIICLDNVKYLPADGGQEVALTGLHYLTVSGYTGVEEFERGKIYRIGAEEGISFTPDDLGLTPNPEEINLRVNVSIEEWDVVTPNAEL